MPRHNFMAFKINGWKQAGGLMGLANPIGRDGILIGLMGLNGV